jgi:hypothetical protein
MTHGPYSLLVVRWAFPVSWGRPGTDGVCAGRHRCGDVTATTCCTALRNGIGTSAAAAGDASPPCIHPTACIIRSPSYVLVVPQARRRRREAIGVPTWLPRCKMELAAPPQT